MIGFTPRPINLQYTSIPLENISEFDKNSGYALGSIRRYGTYKYIALDDIAPTVHFVWEDLEPLNIYGYDLYNDEVIPDPTNVYITNDVTVVYVKSNKHYYKAKHTGYVDFTTENPITPTYFTDLGLTPTPLYRTNLEYPNGRKDTLLWGYDGILNRHIMFDGVLNNQTTNDRKYNTTKQVIFSTNVCLLQDSLNVNIYANDKIKITGTSLNDGYYKILSIAMNRLSFTVEETFTSETKTGNINIYTQTYIKLTDTGVNRIAFFSMECEKIEVKVKVGGITTTYELEMIDSSWINTFELFCFNTPTIQKSSIIEIEPNYSQEFEITFFGDTQKIGEVITGTAVFIGTAEDTVDINSKVYAEIEEASNGDIYIQENITQLDVLDRKTFTMIIDTDKKDAHKEYFNSFLGKRLVLSGSSFDNDNFKYLLTYGFIKEDTFRPRVKEDKTTYNFEIREFKEWLQ